MLLFGIEFVLIVYLFNFLFQIRTIFFISWPSAIALKNRKRHKLSCAHEHGIFGLAPNDGKSNNWIFQFVSAWFCFPFVALSSIEKGMANGDLFWFSFILDFRFRFECSVQNFSVPRYCVDFSTCMVSLLLVQAVAYPFHNNRSRFQVKSSCWNRLFFVCFISYLKKVCLS